MNHFIDVFSPETHATFSTTTKTLAGHRERQRKAAERVAVGDLLVCYLTQLSRWVGLLEVTSPTFEDHTPLFTEKDDPFCVRMNVKPLVWLPPEQGIPIRDPAVWSKLSFTREHPPDSVTWTGAVRTSLAPLARADGELLARLLRQQAAHPNPYPLDASELRILEPHRVRRADGEIAVSVPENVSEPSGSGPDVRESIRIQALLARIGARMSLSVWVPGPDRAAVLKEAPEIEDHLLKTLPLNYDNTTLKTIEYIDVLWLKGRSMARAFEVEHTTAIYSGILRMADLLALQPNMDIRLHIVAPEARKGKVFEEIRRPVFSLLDGKPLSKRCTFLSYDSVREVGELKHLAHLSDSVLDDYQEETSG